VDTKKAVFVIPFEVFCLRKKRNQYTKEYKVEVIDLIAEEGKPIAELAREFGTVQSLLHRCKKRSEGGGSILFPGRTD
jgi:transposase-like protein